MSGLGYGLVLFHNAGPDGVGALDGELKTAVLPTLQGMAGFRGLLRTDIADVQPLPSQDQPYKHMMLAVFESGHDGSDIAALSTLAADLESAKLIDGHAAHVFDWVRPIVVEEGENADTMNHVTVVMANAVPGKDVEYNSWYDDLHVPDCLATPGPIAFRRGKLASAQLTPDNEHPAGYVVLMISRTDDLAAMQAEITARTLGKSESGIAHAPRSPAVSDERTIHLFARRGDLFGNI